MPRFPRQGPLVVAALARTLRDTVMGLSLATAAAVLALATAATPLYRVSVDQAALDDAFEGFHPESLGLTLGVRGVLDADRLAPADRAVHAAPWSAPGVPPPALAFLGDVDASAGTGDRAAQLFARTAVSAHLPDPRPCGDRRGGAVGQRPAGGPARRRAV